MFPNSDPVMFMVAFYGCFLAELVPVPIEVPLTRKVVGPGPARPAHQLGGVPRVPGSGQQTQAGCRFPLLSSLGGEKGPLRTAEPVHRPFETISIFSSNE